MNTKGRELSPSPGDERRLRAVLVQPESVIKIACGTFHVVENSIPDDIVIVGAGWSLERHCFYVTIGHASFDPVPFGDMVPIHPCPVIKGGKPGATA